MDFIHILEGLINKKANIGYLSMQAEDVKEYYADITDLQKDTGYHPKTSLEIRLTHFVDWYKNYHQKRK